MPVQLLSSDQEARINGIKALVYGKSGLGKTMLIATAPSPVLISAESGLLSLRKENIAKVFGADEEGISYNLPVIKIATLDDLTDAHKWAQSSKEAEQFETIGIDSISEIAEVVLHNAKLQVKDKRQAYGELLEQMNDTMRKFRDLTGKHVYMTAKQARIKDDATGITTYGPSFPGSKLDQGAPYLFDEVFNIGIAKTTEGVSYRYLRTQPDLQYEAKDRSGELDEIEQPNLTYIFNKILNGE